MTLGIDQLPGMSYVAGSELLLKGQPLVLRELLLMQSGLDLCYRQMFNPRRVPPCLHLPDNRHQQAYADQPAHT
ncbi:hypothetical protein SAMN04490182_0402 [Pseudomonas cedrina]|uniref:Uncharacterized protein n=2 Tax=Pseudomonas cedrina TaxID=651740 RepID=A0A1V2KCC5_PSECE|nr:hypothetical protein BLL36_10665 [Pseudomonas cedrina subsp. cedrina]SDR96168.1 hypothetical protein SAMN04490182_0402 [Pseudomonas cedrina]